ncbi:MAG: TraC family protein [Patescibacteria group bacterium]
MASISAPASQDFVPVREVRDGILVLKDGSLRSVLLTSSVNFALKSPDEQQSLLFQFQNFLNSLDFSVQIFIQSRKLDIRPYIALLEEKYKEQTNDLLRIQTREYVEFIRRFTETTNIMSKNFFVVVSYVPALIKSGGNPITNILGKRKEETLPTADFEESRTQLEQRIAVVEQGLVRMGVRVVELGTEEVIELLYKMFNPGELDKPVALR